MEELRWSIARIYWRRGAFRRFGRLQSTRYPTELAVLYVSMFVACIHWAGGLHQVRFRRPYSVLDANPDIHNSKNPGSYSNPFFNSVPPGMLYPSLIVAILAAIVASQAIITATFQVSFPIVCKDLRLIES